ncbi:uncharacterized protein BXZ73DRAFT_74311 [Epithele typhae]|uniref:uncharacterized protein n=1 Tax=Epithele typhae TaxID=378194 RepID=UPI00200789A0|nr:uncharacterized protein BXZ73DRAFT_74311 [Epithele typhae]KAH9943331.1 hypothetical protein BXZ73DRAFT_74311 [Epithele typhae]
MPSAASSDGAQTICALPACAAPASTDVFCLTCKSTFYCHRGHELEDIPRHQREDCPSSFVGSPRTRDSRSGAPPPRPTVVMASPEKSGGPEAGPTAAARRVDHPEDSPEVAAVRAMVRAEFDAQREELEEAVRREIRGEVFVSVVQTALLVAAAWGAWTLAVRPVVLWLWSWVERVAPSFVVRVLGWGGQAFFYFVLVMTAMNMR